MMGVGKSTVGRILSRRLHRPFLDTDALLEERSGRTVREIITADGEPAFRDLEAVVLADALAGETPAVIAAAGGVVLRPDNRAVLRERAGKVVWLSAPLDVLLARVRHGKHRPVLDQDPEATLVRLEQERDPLYREVADAIVLSDGRPAEQIADQILTLLR
jgi:shikimate kinase